MRLGRIKLVPEIETFLSDSYKRFRLSLRFQSHIFFFTVGLSFFLFFTLLPDGWKKILLWRARNLSVEDEERAIRLTILSTIN